MKTYPRLPFSAEEISHWPKKSKQDLQQLIGDVLLLTVNKRIILEKERLLLRARLGLDGQWQTLEKIGADFHVGKKGSARLKAKLAGN
jgi:hypothetical protein